MLESREGYRGRSVSSETHMTLTTRTLRRSDSMLFGRSCDMSSIKLYIEKQLKFIDKSRFCKSFVILSTFFTLIIPDCKFLLAKFSLKAIYIDCAIYTFIILFICESLSKSIADPCYFFSYDCNVDIVSLLTLTCELSLFNSTIFVLLCSFGRHVRIVRCLRLVHAYTRNKIVLETKKAPSLFRRGSQVFEQQLLDDDPRVDIPVSEQVLKLCEKKIGQVYIIGKIFVFFYHLIFISLIPIPEIVLIEMFLSLILILWFEQIFNQIGIRIISTPFSNIVLALNSIQSNSSIETSTPDIKRLSQTIQKFSSLLRVGFGETRTSSIGKKTQAIFGYIAISDFGIVTEILQDKICVLVNQVAEIVHGLVDEFGGKIARNDGAGFLIIWNESFASFALASFCSIIAAINQSPVLATYRQHPHLQMRIPNYSVQVHLALHSGSGIEGAIGSEFKLNAAYLGPDIVLTEQLEYMAAHVYKKRLLLTGFFFQQLPIELKKKIRQIDHITGIDIHTIDLDCSDLTVKSVKSVVEKPSIRAFQSSQSVAARFTMGELYLMRAKHESRNGRLFREIFNKAFLNYSSFEFDIARKALRQTILFWLSHDRNDKSGFEIKKEPKYFSLQYESDRELVDHVNDPTLFDGPSVALLRKIS